MQVVPSPVCHMFRPVLTPSSGMSIQKSHKGRQNKVKFKEPLVYSRCFIMMLKYRI